MIKKILLSVLITCILAFSLTACGAGNVGDNSYMENESAQSPDSAQQNTSSTASSQVEKLEGLDNMCMYFISTGLINESSKSDVASQVIGAKDGRKYNATVGSSNFTIELYEFDLTNLNSTAQGVVDSVKATGSFEILNTQVKAELSENNKYLMIYNDTSTNEENIKAKQSNQEIFKNWP